MPRLSPVVLLALLLPACTPRARPAPTPARLDLPPPIPSCAVNPPRRIPVSLRNVEWHGQAGDRTWLLAEDDGSRVLLRLVDGRLTPLELPSAFDPDSIAAVHADGNLLWVLRTDSGLPSKSPAWLRIDVRDAAHPVTTGRESLDPLPPEGPREFALWHDRALFYFGPKRDLLLWDLEAARPLGKRVRSEATGNERPTLRCGSEACFAVTVEGDGPSRRMVVHRFENDGEAFREELGPGHVDAWTTADLHGRTLVVWSSFDSRGLRARLLDGSSGKTLGPAYPLMGVEQDIQDPQAIPDRDGVLLAWQAARVGWRIGRVRDDGKAVENVTSLPAEGSFLTAAAADDGVMAAVFSTGNDYDGSKHEWYATAQAAFVRVGENGKPEEATELLKDERGPGRGGYAAYAMAAPGWAAVLVAPQGETPRKGFLEVLREPCRRQSGGRP